MSENVNKKLEIFAYIAIILMCLATTIVLLKNHFSTNNQTNFDIPKGSKILLDNEVWQNNSKTLLLVLSTECSFCTESVDFYKKLIANKSQYNTRIIAVFPNQHKNPKNISAV